MKQHCTYKKLLSSFIDGELPVHEENSIRKHLETCTDCQRELEGLQFTDQFLSGIEEIEPSNDFDRSFWQKIDHLEARKKQWGSLKDFLFGKWTPLRVTTVTVILLAGIALFNEKPSRPGADDIIMAENLELFMNYEMISNLDLLENWETITTLKENT